MIEQEWWNDGRIINPLKEVLPKGFSLFTDYEGFIRFDRHEDNRLLSIGLGQVMKGTFSPNWIQSFITFYPIEDILEQKFKKSRDMRDGVTLKTRNHGLIFHQEQGKGIYEHLPIVLDTDDAIQRAQLLIVKFIEEYSTPFFDYWKDIRCFLPFLENEDGIRLNDFFAGYATERKMVIWHLCNHPGSKEYINKTINAWEEFCSDNPEDGISIRQFKNMKRIVKELDQTPPIYEWDEKYLNLPS
ncbi:hypothetical protein ACFOG5_08940 [Pedobacter fastidiosus]|uniref:Uncharacterized protein n=1 Tax=Pedobacter fastidiosus TaxID=2765361 RepID=A0ABR7KTG0_9SPHI|nr:hypothetical protein [Pedobacter fastidiosus]MBC6111316.1 hypothetical protein [Pedobacter fastidiosus]